MLLGLLREVELEHHRGDAIGLEVKNLVDEGFFVHALGEGVKRHSNFPIIFGRNFSVQLQQLLACVVSGALYRKNGNGDSRPAFHEFLHAFRQINATGQKDARDIGIGGRKV